jgi:hypothetical protein
MTGARAFDVKHDDPRVTARCAAVRAPRELDPATREHVRTLTPAERLREGIALSAFALGGRLGR